MNIQTTMRTINGQTTIKRESIPPDTYIGESKKQYLARIAKSD